MKLLLLLLLSVHDFHTSLTEMNYNAKERTFEISMRVFSDDLETALARANNGQKIKLDAPSANPAIERYIRSKFWFMGADKQRRAFIYVGHETEGDAQWIYLEMPFAEPFRGGLLQQSLLTEVFDDQTNLVNLRVGAQKKTFMFRRSQPVQALTFD
jgi:hypothetical protein